MTKKNKTINSLKNRLSPKQRLLLELKLKKQKKAGQVIYRNTNIESAPLPMSFAQERQWVMDRLQPGLSLYNVISGWDIDGDINIDVLENSLKSIIKRHSILSMSLDEKNGQLFQKKTSTQLPFRVKEISQENFSKRYEVIKKEISTPFNLSVPPFIRVLLLKYSDIKYSLVITMHHIVSDGWSRSLIANELSHLYTSKINRIESSLPDLPVQYTDYSIWQREWLQGNTLDIQIEYWRNQLTNVSVLELPADYPRPAKMSFKGAVENFTVPSNLVSRLKALTQESNATLFMILISAFQVLLMRYSGQADFAVGTPIAGRNRPELENLVGFFVNTLVFRCKLNDNPSFRKLIEQTRSQALNNYKYQDLPFEKLVEILNPPRDLSHNPIFQTMFVLQNIPLENLQLPGADVVSIDLHTDTAKFDLTLFMTEVSGQLNARLEYATDLFSRDRIHRMAGHFLNLLENIVITPDKPVGLLPLLSSREHREILLSWNNNHRCYPKGNTFHKLFENNVSIHPDATAVVFSEHQLSYSELNKKSNQLAHYLTQYGVNSGKRVAVFIERSIEMLVGLLAVLKLGGTYIPLDPGYPAERLKMILSNSEPVLILTQFSLLSKLPDNEIDPICLDTQSQKWTEQPEHNPDILIPMDHIAYIIYTSGSTGRPKGVMIEHKALMNYLYYASANYFNNIAGSVVSTALVFDATITSLFAPLIAGKKIILLSDNDRTPLKLTELLLSAEEALLFKITPAHLNLVFSFNTSKLITTGKKHRLIIGGEQLLSEQVAKLSDILPEVEIINEYGPTESVVGCSNYNIDNLSDFHSNSFAVPIGKPIPNTQLYILDQYRQPVAEGVNGELYIAGDSLARGYLNRHNLDKERFIHHTLNQEQHDHKKMYKTGDICRYLHDGNIEFIGRVDDQIKLRGYRIEIGEIESHLNSHPLVEKSIVLLREDQPDDKRLTAYVMLTEETITENDLSAYIKSFLPDYMMPSAIVFLDTLPLTTNGKIDRNALPAPEYSGNKANYIAPRSPLEESLALIWCDILNIEQVGIRDNFFDLGGHSILGTLMISRVSEQFDIDVPLGGLFDHPTIENFVTLLEGSKYKVKIPALTSISRTQNIPASFAQERLWFMQQWHNNAGYNVNHAFKIHGKINRHILEKALNLLLVRHEILRTSIDESSGYLFQKIHAPEPLNLDYKTAEDLKNESISQDDYIYRFTQQPFDLSSSPLLRVLLIKRNKEEIILILSLHHIVTDGWSTGIILHNISTFYQKLTDNSSQFLKPLTVQYADYAAWQRELLQGQLLKSQISYWREQLADLPVLELHTDQPRPAQMSYKGAVEYFTIPSTLVSQLKILAKEEHATLFMVLLAAYQVLLMRYSGQADFAVGTPIAGRNRPELENLVGFFVNTLVLRANLSRNPGFREAISRTRSQTLAAWHHQELPFEKLVEVLNPIRDLSRHPLFQVMFTLQNSPEENLSLPGMDVEPFDLHTGTAKFDLSLSLANITGEFKGRFEYATDLFSASRIQSMSRHFLSLLENIVSNSESSVWTLPLLTKAEQQMILLDWNKTAQSYPKDKTLSLLFEEQVNLYPNSVAVVFGKQKISFQELNQRANQLAFYLKQSGVEQDSKVALCVERSIDMTIAMLAILKAGGAYVPLDPDYPKERLAMMLKDSKPVIILTHTSISSLLPENKIRTINLDTQQNEWSHKTNRNLNLQMSAKNLAYIIYTSGSTGKPKGVMVTHQAITRLVKNQNYINLDSKTIIAQVANVSFDAATFEIWGALLNGGHFVILDRAISLNPEKFITSLQDAKINTLFLTTALFNELIRYRADAFKTVNTVLFGGEACDPQFVSRCLENTPGHLVHVYGPTESTTFATWYEVKPLSGTHTTFPIGQPVANTQCFILDHHNNPVPPGIPGELYIGGDGLARGYQNQDKLTAEKFIEHPFVKGRRLYRTGDKVCWRDDGNIEFLGRMDHQVKLRGFRIEPGEIEALLNTHTSVSDSIVILREDRPGDKRLVAYATIKEQITGEQLLSFLKSSLPNYMMPTAVVIQDTLPLTSNGKIDRKALPKPNYQISTNDAIKPRNQVEKQLQAIWKEILGAEIIGIRDNFFDSGGHSLLVVTLLEHIEQKFNCRLHINSLWYNAGTIEQQAEIIQSKDHAGRTEPVILIQKGGHQLPVFCIHTIGGGNLFHYEDLALHLKNERSIYGLQARGVDGTEAPDHSVESMASYCIKNMRSIQPIGPYILCGFSSGGTVAFEMSRQLQKDGETVARLFLIDSFSPLHRYSVAQKASKLWKIIKHKKYRELQEIIYHWSLNILDMKHRRQLKALGEAHRWGLWNYQPGVYDGDIIYFEAIGDSSRIQAAYTGWKELITGEIVLEQISGTHGLMVKEPHVSELANQLQKYLKSI